MKAAPPSVSEERVVGVRNGHLRGVVADGIARFLGVPYAAPPFGENRFQRPRPHPPWDGVRDATSFGASPPQAPYEGAMGELLPSVVIPGEDILNLNIWAPAHATPQTPVPVMLWFYGGGLTRGSNALQTYDGTAFARDGVLLVSANYRVGAEGYSVLDGAATNAGLADQVAALEWVRDEIRAFGGDPEQVTVFGQSAGGGSVATLLASERASALFKRAIIMSAPLGLQGGDPGRISRLMAKDLAVETTREAFAAIPPDTLVESQTRLMRMSKMLRPGPGYGGVVGDDLIPVNPWDAVRAGRGADIPVMVGYTAEELGLYLGPHDRLRKIGWVLLLAVAAWFKFSPRTIQQYRRGRPHTAALEILGALLTDAFMRGPANRFADMRHRQGAATYVYEFAWRSPRMHLGAAHAVDVTFVFDTLDSDESAAIAGPDRPQSLATEMHTAWVNFARSGQPGWPAWDDSRPVMVFNTPSSAVVLAPREEERRAVEHLLPPA
jgi:para-nitrobenzyl esterase